MKCPIFLKRIFTLKFILGLVIGGLLGYAYYYFIGCRGGSCPIWADPWRSTLIGLALGGILMFDTSKKKKDTTTPQEPQ